MSWVVRVAQQRGQPDMVFLRSKGDFFFEGRGGGG